jgi:hypothetical protein
MCLLEDTMAGQEIGMLQILKGYRPVNVGGNQKPEFEEIINHLTRAHDIRGKE